MGEIIKKSVLDFILPRRTAGVQVPPRALLFYQSLPAHSSALGTDGLDMGEADGDGVSRIGGRGLGEAKERADHKTDLLFLGSSASDDRLFHAAWGVFMDFQATAGGSQKGDPAGRAQNDGRAITLNIDDVFDGQRGGVEFLDGCVQGVIDGHKTRALGELGRIGNHAIGQHLFAVGCVGHDGVAGSPERGIDGEENVGGHDAGQADQILPAGRNIFWRDLLIFEPGGPVIGGFGTPGFGIVHKHSPGDVLHMSIAEEDMGGGLGGVGFGVSMTEGDLVRGGCG